jgi:hypothetical protein
MRSYQDILCKSHTFTHTGSPAAPSVSISGRVRLFGFQWIAGSGASAVIPLNFVNGTSYDASKILLAFKTTLGDYPNQDYFIQVPSGGMLFEEGLFVRDESASAGTPSAPEVGHVSIFYQLG